MMRQFIFGGAMIVLLAALIYAGVRMADRYDAMMHAPETHSEDDLL